MYATIHHHGCKPGVDPDHMTPHLQPRQPSVPTPQDDTCTSSTVDSSQYREDGQASVLSPDGTELHIFDAVRDQQDGHWVVETLWTLEEMRSAMPTS